MNALLIRLAASVPFAHIRPMSKVSGMLGRTPKYRPGRYGPHFCHSDDGAWSLTASTREVTSGLERIRKPAARAEIDSRVIFPCW